MPRPVSPAVRNLLCVTGLAVLVAGALIVASLASGDDPEPVAVPPGAAVVDGLPERDGLLGDPRAPVLTEYADLQCPVCRAFSERTLPTVIDDYVRTGRVRLALQPLSFIGEDSERAAKVASGAQRQGALWAFVERLFARQGAENSGWVTDDALREALRAAGADPGRALRAADAADADKRLAGADASAARHGIGGTPSFTLTTADGETRLLEAASSSKVDPLDPAAFTAALDAALPR